MKKLRMLIVSALITLSFASCFVEAGYGYRGGYGGYGHHHHGYGHGYGHRHHYRH